MSAIRFINIKELHHMGTRVEKIDNRLTQRNRYGSDVEIKGTDTFYREGDVAGSYLFYEVANLKCALSSANKLQSQETDRQFTVLVEQRRVTGRKYITEYRQLLLLSLAKDEPTPSN